MFIYRYTMDRDSGKITKEALKVKEFKKTYREEITKRKIPKIEIGKIYKYTNIIYLLEDDAEKAKKLFINEYKERAEWHYAKAQKMKQIVMSIESQGYTPI